MAKKDNKKVAYKPIVDEKNKTVSFIIKENDKIDFDPTDGTVARADVACLICKQITKAKDVRRLGQEGMMGERLIASVLYNSNEGKKKYRIATDKDTQNFKNAQEFLKDKIKTWCWLDNPLPNELMPTKLSGGVCTIYGLTHWSDVFNSRQKLALITFMDRIKKSYDFIKEDCQSIDIEKHGIDYGDAAKAIIGYIGIILSRHSSYNANLCWWEPLGERSFNVFGRQALPMVWDYSEQNPFGILTGNWSMQTEITKEIINNLNFSGNHKVTVTNFSSTSLHFPDAYFDAVLTDPPYYDNVYYADLSDFFYVWLKRSVGDLFPDIFITPLTPKTTEIIASKHRHKNANDAKEYFEASLSDSFKEIYRVLKSGGISVIVYAHKTTSGWETMLNSLVNAGLVVTASWPIHTEMKTRLVARTTASLASSIYMVCRKTERQPVGYYSELQPKIKVRIEEKLQQFWNEGIAGGDFFISAIGPAMETFSQYERVEKYSGQKVTTAELLDYIRTVSTDFIVKKLLKDASSASIDNESKFYLTYRWTHLDNIVSFDDAMKLAHAEGINLEDLWGAGGFVKKKGSDIEVLGPKERGEVGKINNMVDVMHKTVLLWEKGDRDAINELLSETGYRASGAFWQFCQAVAESLINGNKEKQLLEGLLIGKDNYMSRSKPKEQKELLDYN